ncbi:MAG TPA: MOSC and FAD-binding oxidoreductase domain-containing protein [Stellaceae bacterium]|nr:MOSC and FAD-binding oxidoreductase domain-containing protein [Stellaceae bacterium]
MSVLVSVNVGLPREVPWQGRTVRTAIWKRPVAGRVMARRLNLDGDGQADLHGHGGERRAVLVYQLDSYRYWERFLGRSDFERGQFGENLTVEGLADSEVCVGDRFRIGGAVFEVSQPRVTCYRLAIRMDHVEMPALLVAHHRPGFYCRVIEEGEIGAGDPIEKIVDGPERMTVAEIDALLYTSRHPAEALGRSLRIPALSWDWQESFRALLDAGSQGRPSGNAGLVASAPVAWRGFRPLQVVAATVDSDDVRSFTLASADRSPLPEPLPGQHIVIRLPSRPDAPTLTRIYSLSGPPAAGTYRISVKREAGAGSVYLHEHVRPGDTVETSAPRGTFVLPPGTSPVVLMSAGIGVTPMLAMLYAAAAAGAGSAREVWWLHGARDGAHHCFAEEARTLLRSLARAHSTVLYSRPRAADRLGRDFDAIGHLDIPLLQRLGVPQESDFYLCGPPAFLTEIDAALGRWGVAGGRIHQEVFGSEAPAPSSIVDAPRVAPHLPAGEAGTGPLVTFTRSNLAVRWDPRFKSLLELAEACAVPARWSCRSGVCHSCECALFDGALRYGPEPLDPPAEGNALICCSAPASDIQLDL